MQWHIGPFRLDRDHACLWRGDERVLLRPKTFDLLVYLVEHAGELVSKDNLLAAIWPQMVVAESALTVSVSELRKVLGEGVNEFVISGATREFLGGMFRLQDLGEQVLRGIVTPLPIYRVEGGQEVESRFEAMTLANPTPLVGREQEVSLLLDRWTQSRQGYGQIVLLSGEAGIGKSRLVHTLKAHLEAEPHIRLECRNSPYHQHTALYPITDLLQRLLHWQSDEAPEERLRQLEQFLRSFELPLAELVPLFAPLLSLSLPETYDPPLHLTPQQQRQKTLEAIVSLVLQQAQRQPVLFILEDLHWTDPTTLKFLELLIDQVPTASLCVLLTCRLTFQPSWRHRSYLSEVTVNRLSPTQIERLAAQIADGKQLPGQVLAQIVERTDGVPLFVEELTKSILESGHLEELDERFELVDSLSTLPIPSTLQDSLMARLDRLDSAKTVAQYASVIGRQFSYELLQAVSELNKPILQHELGRLVEAELDYIRSVPHCDTWICLF